MMTTDDEENLLHTNHSAPPPRRGVVARRSVRSGDSSCQSPMVRISSRASRRTLTPATTKRSSKNKYRYLVWIALVSLASVGSAFLYFGRVKADSSAQIGPDGEILKIVRERHYKKRDHHPHREEEEAVEEDDETTSNDDGAETQEDDGAKSEELTSQDKEEEDDETDDEGGNSGDMHPAVLPAHRVLSLGMPFLLYGTAWKKDETARLVRDAVTAGFRFIDTACQPKHYNEPGVGEGWTLAANELSLDRRDLFLQTKFSSVSGQDPNNIPYDPSLPIQDQVWQSLDTSLRNLRTTYLDSWVMHGPEPTLEKTMEVYRVMEEAVDTGKVRRLGISNCYNFPFFKAIYDNARIKPEVLQNRFYEDSNWDQELRDFCKENDIWYQSFWTLTANRNALHTQEAKEWAAEKDLTPQTLMYAYLMSLGYGTPLDGTTNWDHMVEDVAVMQRIQKEFQDEDVEDRIFNGEQDLRRFERLLGF